MEPGANSSDSRVNQQPVGSSRRRRSRPPAPIINPNLASELQRGSSVGSAGARQRADSVAPARSHSSLRGGTFPVAPPDVARATEADPQEHLPGTNYVDTVPAIQMESGMTS